MGKLKNIGSIAFVALLMMVFVVMPFSIAIINDFLASDTLKEIKSAGLPENTKLLSEYAVAGKVSGNGNGMQYFGAVLIKSDLDVSKIQEYYEKSDCEISVQVKAQESDKITVLNSEHYFDGVDGQSFENCYIVYGYGSGGNSILDLDLRGH